MHWSSHLRTEQSKAPVGPPSKAETLLLGQMPKIREFFASKVGPALVTAAKDDTKLRAFSESVYSLLPAPIRFVVKQEKFVQFCFAHRDKLIVQPPSTPA